MIEALVSKRGPPKLCSIEVLMREVVSFLQSNRILLDNVIALNRDGPCIVMKGMMRIQTSVISVHASCVYLSSCIAKIVSEFDFDITEFVADLKYILSVKVCALEN